LLFQQQQQNKAFLQQGTR